MELDLFPRIHGIGLFTYAWRKIMVNVYRENKPHMDPMDLVSLGFLKEDLNFI